VPDLLRNRAYDTSAADATSSAAKPTAPPTLGSQPPLPPLFDDIERRTFDFFWGIGNPVNGLVPDRYPSRSPCSIAAVGFALTAYAIGADRGYVSRAQARDARSPPFASSATRRKGRRRAARPATRDSSITSST
jgi:Uncharacterized protein conserved in bacteria